MQDIIETERLILRPLRLHDAKALSFYGNDIDIARMTGTFPHPFPVLSAEYKILYLQSKHRQGLAYPYALTQDGGDMIGIMDLFRPSLDDPLEIGYWVGRPFWGLGYATEAARGAINEARASLGTSLFTAGVYTDNPASLRVLEKLGFQIEGEPAPYFSMARLAYTPSLTLRLKVDNTRRGEHCAAPENRS